MVYIPRSQASKMGHTFCWSAGGVCVVAGIREVGKAHGTLFPRLLEACHRGSLGQHAAGLCQQTLQAQFRGRFALPWPAGAWLSAELVCCDAASSDSGGAGIGRLVRTSRSRPAVWHMLRVAAADCCLLANGVIICTSLFPCLKEPNTARFYSHLYSTRAKHTCTLTDLHIPLHQVGGLDPLGLLAAQLPDPTACADSTDPCWCTPFKWSPPGTYTRTCTCTCTRTSTKTPAHTH